MFIVRTEICWSATDRMHQHIRVCHFCAMICTDIEVATDIPRATDNSVFGTNLYNTDGTNSILEIMLAAHCPIFGTQLLYLKPDRGTQLVNPSCDSCFVTGSIDPVLLTPVSWPEVSIQWLWLLFRDRKYRSSGCDSCFVTGSTGFEFLSGDRIHWRKDFVVVLSRLAKCCDTAWN